MSKWLGLLCLLLVLMLGTPAEATISIVQSTAKCETTGATAVCSFSSAVTGGNVIILSGSMYSTNPATLNGDYSASDTAANTYNKRGTNCGGFYQCGFLISAYNVTGGFTQVSITCSCALAPSIWAVSMMEVSGLDPAGAFDVSATNFAAAGATTFSTGLTPTTNVTDELLVGMVSIYSDLTNMAFTVDAAWTQQVEEHNGHVWTGLSVVTKIVSVTGQYEHTWTGLSTPGPPKLMGIIATFKAAPGGGANTLPTGCTFTWDANTDADLAGYYLYVDLSTIPYSTANRHAVAAGILSRTCAQVGISADGTYHAALSAIDTSGNESSKTALAAPYATSFTLSGVSPPNTLLPPTLTSPGDNGNPVGTHFSWSGVSGATGYVVHVYEPAQPYQNCNPALTTNTLPNYCATTTSLDLILDLLPETDYTWWVCTLNGAGQCGVANSDSFTTGTLTPLSSKTMSWSWSGLDTGGARTAIVAFRIMRAASMNGPWTQIAEVGITVRSYTDADPPSPMSCYRIDAVSVTGVTPGSVSASNCAASEGTTIPIPPTLPSAPFATVVQ